MREDRQLIVITHLSQLITLLVSGGSLIIPLVIWFTNKGKVHDMDRHGKNIVNFQLSLIVYSVVCIPLILFLGIGLIGLIALGLVSIVLPIMNALKASNGEIPLYPLTITFLK